MIYLIRHAESIGNAGAVTTDINYNPLSEKGEQQAVDFAKTIKQRPDLIIMSPYIRTQQTAKPTIDKFFGVATEIWPIQEFTYLDRNKCFNTTQAERAIIAKEYKDRNDPDYIDGDGAESFNQMIDRVDNMLEKLRKIDKDKFVLVFCHGQFMKAALMRLNNAEMLPNVLFDNMPNIENTEVIKLEL